MQLPLIEDGAGVQPQFCFLGRILDLQDVLEITAVVESMGSSVLVRVPGLAVAQTHDLIVP